MFRLEADNTGSGASQFKPPQCILLPGASNVVGRGSEANIQMPLSWLSRKHATITRVDGNCIIEAHGLNGVFVNDKRVEFATLRYGDRVTFGGGAKNAPVGSRLSSTCGPYVCYSYQRCAKSSNGLDSWYRNLSRPEDIIEIEDVVNGQVIMRSYHVEDFNSTDELSPEGSVCNPPAETRKPQRQMAECTTHSLNSTTPVDAEQLECDVEMESNPNHTTGKRKSGKRVQANDLSASDTSSNFDADEVLSSTVRRLRSRKLSSAKKGGSGCLSAKSKQVNRCREHSTDLTVTKDSTCPGVKSSEDRMRGLRKRKNLSYVMTEDEEPDTDEHLLDDGDDFHPAKPSRHKSVKKLKLENAFSLLSCEKGKRAPGKKPKKCEHKKMDEEEQALLNSWYNKPIPKPAQRMVEILNGVYQRRLYNFNDKELFQVVYKNGEDQRYQNLWDTDRYDVIVYLDAALFEYKVKLGQLDEEDLARVLELVKMSSSILGIDNYDQPKPPTKMKTVCQPEGIEISLKQYQLQTLGWMYLLESEVNKTWTVSRLAEWSEAELDVAFDLTNKGLFFPPLPSAPSTELRIRVKGGILADEMGLGKTITLLSLIVTHQDTESFQIPSPAEFYKNHKLYLTTKATLVIAPSHLTAQWKEEAERCAPSLSIVLITTKPQFEKCKYVDILKADIVLVSIQFLLINKVYTTLPSGPSAEASLAHLLHKPGTNPLLEKCPNLSHFDWWRLVCDEAHELIAYENKKCPGGIPRNGLVMLQKLKARHKWYMTGTPLPYKENSLRGALQFLEMEIDDTSLTYPDHSLKLEDESLEFSPIHKFILDTIYVRNTKMSIGAEYNVPEYVEELMLLKMSDVERGVYNRARNEQERRQLCCHLQIADSIKLIAGMQQKTLDEVKQAMIVHTKSEISRLEKCIEQTRKDINVATENLIDEERQYMRDILKNRISRYKQKIESDEDTIKSLSSSLSYFESIVPRITQSVDEPCVICLDNIDVLTMTPCGHLFCKKCIVPCIQQQLQCPTCRKPTTESDLIEVRDPNQRENLNRSAELQKLTEQFGTKMAYLIFYLRYLFKSDLNSRAIIFSQWDELLHKIGNTLNEHGIRNVFVKGNVHVRNKAIVSFRKQKQTRVIMLSLQNAASGTNLVEASHVILIDPVAGSKEEARAIEAQAIGRAHRMGQYKEVRVVRMIVKDTIEHELYLRNNSENIQQVELEFNEQESDALGMQVIHKVCKIPKSVGQVTSMFVDDVPSTSSFSVNHR